MIVRWGLESLPEACAEAGVKTPFVIASARWQALELPLRSVAFWREVPSHRIEEAAAEARAADGVLAIGGGSAIDLGKAISAASAAPLVSVPTTYAGAEWTSYFGIRDPDRRMRGGGAGARPTAVVYEPRLTLDLPRETTVGTALNALAHCAEALYAEGRNDAADHEALAGAELIAVWLPRVVVQPDDLDARTHLLEGACRAGAALAGSMLALAHAIAQAIGGRYGLPHGSLNAICLPPVLRFNARYAPEAIRRFGDAIGSSEDPSGGVEALARLGGPTRLRDLGVPAHDLPALAQTTAGRAGNQANPHPATPGEIEELLHEIW